MDNPINKSEVVESLSIDKKRGNVKKVILYTLTSWIKLRTQYQEDLEKLLLLSLVIGIFLTALSNIITKIISDLTREWMNIRCNISLESDVLVISIIDRILLISLPDEDGRRLVINEILKRLNINSISFDDIISNNAITKYSLNIISNEIEKGLTNEVDEIGKSFKD